MLRIKQLRKEHNLTQRELAKRLNVSQKAIDLWEKGITEPKAGIVSALADMFSCTGDYILGREDELGNVNVMRDLTENEQYVLKLHSRLNKQNQAEWLNFANYLIEKQ